MEQNVHGLDQLAEEKSQGVDVVEQDVNGLLPDKSGMKLQANSHLGSHIIFKSAATKLDDF